MRETLFTIPYEIIVDLREMNFGNWEGQLMTDIEQSEDAQQFAHFWNKPDQFSLESAEDILVFQERVVSALDLIIDNNKNKTILIVTHMRRTLLKLTFEDKLVWDRKGMYRTPHLSLPFKVLGEVFQSKKLMVPRARLEPLIKSIT
jgi:probable phosphoglycerate mutase